MAGEAAFRRTGDGLTITVRATPRAARDGIDGFGPIGEDRAALFVRIRAAPADGAANAAIAAVLAKRFGRPKRAVTLVAGASSRIKRFEIQGEPVELVAIAAALPVASKP